MASYDIGKLVWQVTGDTSGLDSALKKTDSNVKSFGSGFLGVAAKIGAAFGVYKIAESMLGIGKAAISASAGMEQQRVAFTTMLGSAAAAQALIKDLAEFAASTPFQINEVVDASKKLIAFGETAGNVTGTLGRIGDVAAGLSIPLGELVEIYGKARVQQTLYAEDLNQLAGRGIPIFEELGKVLNVDASQIKKMGSEGKIQFGALEQVFKNLTKEGGKFAGLMDAQSKTLAGKWSNFNDNLDKSLTIMGDLASVELKGLVDELNRATKEGGILDTVLRGAGMAMAELASGFTSLLSGLNDEFEKQYTVDGKILDLERRKAEAIQDYADRVQSGNEHLAKGASWNVKQIAHLNQQIDALKQYDFLNKGQLDIEQQRVLAAQGLAAEDVKAKQKKEDADKKWAAERIRVLKETSDFESENLLTESQRLQEELDRRLEDLRKFQRDKQKLAEDTAVVEGIYLDKIADAEWKSTAERINAANSYYQQAGTAITGLLSAFQNLYSARAQADIDSLDAQMEAELEAAGVSEETQVEQAQREYDAAVATGDALAIEEKRRALVKSQIEAKYQKEKAKLEYENALRTWEFQRAIAAIQIPLSIMNAIASGAQAPWFLQPGFMIGMGITAGVAAGAQFAAVEAAKPQVPKYASGGIIPGSSQGTPIIAGDGGTELVSNADQMANILSAIGNGAGVGGGVRQVPAMAKEDLFNMIFNASQNGDLFIAERALVKR